MNIQSAIDRRGASAAPGTAATPEWRLALLSWAALSLGILGLFWRDTVDLALIYWNNSTFQHALLVPPIIAYLVWSRRAELSRLTPRPYYPAAALLLVGGVGWLLGELAGVALVRHTALVGMLMVSVPLVFGLTVARGLTFPLFYALFLIPFGDQLIAPLQMITAKICIWLLDLFNVPAFIDGVFIQIPTGAFEVAEACSGVRFLIAMIAFSTLVAHLCFKSTVRRIVCVVSAVVLSILANGLRAWGTIYIAWLTDPTFAKGVDHVVYGWVFFAVIMAVVLAVGWFFFDRPVDDPAFDPQKLEPRLRRPATPPAFAIAAAAGLFAVAAAPAYGAFMEARPADSATIGIDMPQVPGWRQVPDAGSGWQPRYDNADAAASQSYVDAEGRRVDLFIAAYDRQSDDSEMITYGNGLIEPDGDWSWGRDLADPAGGQGLQLHRRPYTRAVWRYYLVGGELTGSDYAAKLQTLKTRLFGGPTFAAVMVISSESVGELESGEDAVADFQAALGSTEAVIQRAAIR